MGRHVIVGAGLIGTGTARILLDQGHQVVLVTRRGTRIDGVEPLTADASDPAALRRAAEGADALYNCANPAYHRWVTDWPPIGAALLGAAEATGAVLVTMANLYVYGPVDAPMTESTPMRPSSAKATVRARMWEEALAAHRAGRVRAVEVRAGDFLGAGAQSLFGEYVLPGVLAGKRVLVPGDPDMPHSFTYTGDAAALLARASTDERAWGRVWHAPSNPPVTMRAMATEAATLAGVGTPKLAKAPAAALWATALFNRDVREFMKVRYQFIRPFEMDSTAATETFGLTPTPMPEIIAELVAAGRTSIAK